MKTKVGIRNKHIEIKYIQNILPFGWCILLIGTFLEMKVRVVFGKVFRMLIIFIEKRYVKVQTLITRKKLSDFFLLGLCIGQIKRPVIAIHFNLFKLNSSVG